MSAGSYSGTLKHSGFQPFLWTQFLTALNDNIFKMIVSLVAVDIGLGTSVSGTVLRCPTSHGSTTA
jgi:hypothetical protein